MALLELETPVDFDQFPHIRPVCLPDTEDLQLDLTERDGVVAGWGVTEVDYVATDCDYTRGEYVTGSSSDVLKKIEDLR